MIETSVKFEPEKTPEAGYQRSAGPLSKQTFLFEPEKNARGRIPKEHKTCVKHMCLGGTIKQKTPEAGYQRSARLLLKKDNC